jgi:CRP-like cAMP-binding protein
MFIVHSGELVVTKLGASGRVVRIAGLEPGDFFGEMTLIEMQNRSATVVAGSPTVLYELTARNLYTYYKAPHQNRDGLRLSRSRRLGRRRRGRRPANCVRRCHQHVSWSRASIQATPKPAPRFVWNASESVPVGLL